MASITLEAYVEQVNASYDEETDEQAATVFSLSDPHVLSTKLFQDDYTSIVEEMADPSVAEMIIYHLRVVEQIHKRSYDQALTLQCQLVQHFGREFQQQKEDNWGITLMANLCDDLRRIALTARLKEDPIVRSEEHAPTAMERAADVIMGLFRVCAADTRTKEEDTKRWAMLMLVNHLFKIYFKINRLQLCKPLIRAIEAQSLKDKYPIEEIVTYKYYVGRKAMFDSEFDNAAQCLEFAFTHCSIGNKRKVLTYLIPVKMFLGWLPTREALEKYDMLQFYDLGEALKLGDVRKFDLALKTHEESFIKNGVFFTLEKLRMILYRNLFKKVSLIYGKPQVPIQALELALRWAGYEDIDLDETSCILCNLIYIGQIRGYISHQHQMLVVSKQNPFPKISGLTDSAYLKF